MSLPFSSLPPPVCLRYWRVWVGFYIYMVQQGDRWKYFCTKTGWRRFGGNIHIEYIALYNGTSTLKMTCPFNGYLMELGKLEFLICTGINPDSVFEE